RRCFSTRCVHVSRADEERARGPGRVRVDAARVNLYLSDLGFVGALGATKADVLRGLLDGDRSGMVPYGPLLTGRHTVVGRVGQSLEPLAPELAELDCRNNRLL